MCDYWRLACNITWVQLMILRLTCSVIKNLRIVKRCSQKSIVVNKNQQGASNIKLLKNVKLLKKYCCVSAGFGEVK